MTNSEISQLSDERLMEQYRLGVAEAFEELYRRYSGRVYGYLKKRLPAEQLHDVFQDVFLKLHRNRARYSRKLLFAPWLFAITRHLCIDAQRKLGREGEANRLHPALDLAAQPNSTQPLMLPAEVQLQQREQEILALRFEADLDFEQIARRLNLTNSNVRKISSRAIQKLREYFKQGK